MRNKEPTVKLPPVEQIGIVVNDVDTHGQSPWHSDWFKLRSTPCGRIRIHPRAMPVEPCPSGLLDKATEYYSSTFGWGPFEVREVKLDGFTYKGKTGSCRQKSAFAKSGPIEIELIQVLDGETPHTEFLRQKGEGLEHIRFRVDDLDKTLAELATEGIYPIYHKRIASSGVAFAYISSDKIGGVMFELFERKNK